MQRKKKHQSAAFHLSILTVCSRILGFLRITVIANIFGASDDADIINALFSFPNAMRRFLAEGSFSDVFMPELISSTSDFEFQQRMRSSITLHWLIVTTVCVLGFLFSKQLVNLLYYFPTELQMKSAESLFRWFFVYLFCIVFPAICLVVLHIKSRFIPGGIGPLFFSVSVIIIVLLFSDQLGIRAFVIGVLLGGFLQFSAQYIPFRLLGYRLLPCFRMNWRYGARLLKKWMLCSTTTLAGIVTNQVAISLASSLSTGSVSYVANALFFYQLPIGVFAYSVLTVFFPKLTTAYHAQHFKQVRFIISWGVSQLWFLLIPSTLFLSLFPLEIIRIALGHGDFTPDAVAHTARLLQLYSLSLFPASAYLLFVRYFIGKKDIKKIVLSSILFAASDIVLSVLLLRSSLKIEGLPIAFFISMILCTLLLGILYYREHQYIKEEIKSVLSHLIKSSIALCTALFLVFVFRFLLQRFEVQESFFRDLIMLIGSAVLYAGCILFLYRIFRIRILRFPVDIPMQ